MSRLQVAEGLSLPLDWVTLSTVVYGARGSGKTTFGRVVAEEAHKQNQRFGAIDLKGDWSGLKSTADGKGEAIPIVIFGGDRADLPLEPGAESGHFIAEVVSNLEQSWVIDLEHFSKGKQVVWLAAFFDRLYDANREPLLLLLDEAQRYAPQKPMPGAQECLGAVEDLVKLGRKHGIGPVLFTQRGSGLNKEVSELCDMMVAFRTPGVLDQGRVKDWLSANATQAQGVEVMSAISGFDTGVAAFASNHPDLKLFKIARVRRAETFDSSATPKVGQRKREPKRLAQPDLEALREKMAETIERAKENDPTALRQEVKLLRAQVRELQDNPMVSYMEKTITETQEVVPSKLEEKLFSAEHRLSEMIAEVRELGIHVAEAVDDARAALVVVRQTKDKPAKRSEEVTTNGTSGGTKTAPIAQTPRSAPIPRRTFSGTSTVPLEKAERLILNVLAQYESRSKSQLSILTGYAQTTKSYKNAISSLRSKGYITKEWPERITDAGLQVIGPVEPLPTGRDLFLYWMHRTDQLDKAARDILHVVYDAFPGGYDRDALAEATDYATTTKSFKNGISKLRTLELIQGGVYGEPATASPTFFE